MRLAKFRTTAGTIGHGIVEADAIAVIAGDLLGNRQRTGERHALSDVRLLAPIIPPNLIAIGRNYLAHAQEGDADAPTAPIVFLKATTTITDPGAPIPIPSMAPDEVDYEAELAVVIARTCRDVSEAQALDHVLGYTCANDVSARDCQRNDPQWARGKSFDGFCPLGPWIETDLDPDRSRVRLTLNDAVMQDADTGLMIFSVRFLISYLSRCMTLLPGTVILTGTPAGCGFARKPPVWMKPGDRVTVAIAGIGELSNPVTTAAAKAALRGAH
ncbi:MAG: fumarylacetoacetate hydrolase family protein [Planctomycetes bacterium]|nr:fumarylacetoacetate hydrolase family protein [Planctomycetota bacterium]